MPFDQYHEPFEKLPEETRTFARLIMSLIEEADAINVELAEHSEEAVSDY